MAFKESEAGTKWCPMVRYEGDSGGSFNRGFMPSDPTNAPTPGRRDLCRCNCLGSSCAMWIYQTWPNLKKYRNIYADQAAATAGIDASALERDDSYDEAASAILKKAIDHPSFKAPIDGWDFESIEMDEENFAITITYSRSKDPDATGYCGLART